MIDIEPDMLDNVNFPSNRVIQWMNVIRDENIRMEYSYRILENFWASQIRSKSWLINVLKHYFPNLSGNVCVAGGWYGLLAQMLADNFSLQTVFSLDVDPECEIVGRKLCGEDPRIKFYTMNAKFFTNYKNISAVINTSTEHMSQEEYDSWLEEIPNNVPIILQGNNFYNCNDHIRCQNTLSEFNEINKLKRVLYSRSLDCVQFHRFMTVGYKN